MNSYDLMIVGGGPAGAAAAITLAERGVKVVVLEAKRMPRPKLCGEFITAECLPLLERLGVVDQLIRAGAQPIRHLRLIASSGNQVGTSISEISRAGCQALGLSRFLFDQILYERALTAGATCLDRIAVKRAFRASKLTYGVEALSLRDGQLLKFETPLIIDASGRNSRLTLPRRERVAGRRGARRYAMKAHLENVRGIDDQVELFFFDGGYGGLSRVENGLFNLCFLVNERILRNGGIEPEKVLAQTIMRNPVARERLRNAKPAGDWLSVGPLKFGPLRRGSGQIMTIGDAAGMIDPFSGTGIQIALRTGELAAQAIISSPSPERAISTYSQWYRKEFAARLRATRLLRGIALSPTAANLAASVLSRLPALAQTVLRATRSWSQTQ